MDAATLSRSNRPVKMFLILLYLPLLFANCHCSSFRRPRSYEPDENGQDNLISNYLETSRPYFMEKISNQTVVVGREATFQCVVNNLNKYQVAWVHKDKRTVLALHDKVINNKNGRVRVTNHAKTSFYLHIRDVQLEDAGEFMCQINSEPLLFQSAYLHVVVPPKFIENRTSSDVEVKEGESVDLRCAAQATPDPEIRWRRESNQEIQVRSGSSTKKVSVVYGSYLNINKATKLDMGAYICIANNSIPAAISKRVWLGVTFPPLVYVPKAKISAYVGQEATLACLVEWYPEAMYYWNKSNQMIINSSNQSAKYEVSYIRNATVPYKGELRLRIRNLKPADFTSYVCAVSNHMGKTMGTVLLNMLESPSTTPRPVISTYRPPPPPPIQSKPPRPKVSDTSNPIRVPLPDFGSESSSEEDFNTIYSKPTRRRPNAKNGQVPKPKNYDPNQNNVENELYPWPINQSSSCSVSSVCLLLLFVCILLNGQRAVGLVAY